MSAVEPIRWKGDRLELLDQRLLPDKAVYVTCRSAEDVAQAIRDMVVRGRRRRSVSRPLLAWSCPTGPGKVTRRWQRAGLRR